jgi:cobalt-precorrin 5A hydrolase
MAQRDAGHAMELDKTMGAVIVAGIGCRRGASGEEIAAAVAAALIGVGRGSDAIDLMAAPATKASEPGLAAAANALSVPLMFISENDLKAAGHRTRTRSERVMALLGVPSAAEAAALAAAGPAAELLSARIALGPVTCALAEARAL